ncbi:hypothetical protein HYPSUDRAFT_40402 [Hypholoma sublateritium FD-334 SS-4]|uniref:Calcineurin-like phosphoesterase domain-containing protein n=1 Tax=Hypholoma sublateritium (strain FD-334 SS-4) TaxID=945553 RepID=A0A0D2MH05_HYPSF|nr:hypothetical protein HYPSUDRAFT_40402 [Hypholoma sublateritium FD-334 SS-4]
MTSISSYRQLLAYATVAIFLVFIFFYGTAESFRGPSNVSSTQGAHEKIDLGNPTLHPDFSNYFELRKLTIDEFPLDDPYKRVIVVGDLHGMNKPFHKLLDHLDYVPSKDHLIHVGDIVSKGSHKGSLAILNYMTSRNITGVRGNHDQKVVEWRAWIEWISSKRGGKEWISSLEKRWYDYEVSDEDSKLKDSASWLETFNTSTDKKWLSQIPKGWILFSDHYKLARDMSNDAYNYLLGLPLRLYVPSAHTFIVHAGILPSNPLYAMDNKHKQPLARIPVFPKHPTEDKTNSVEGLRQIQEIGIITEIPQNTDPWVTLNIRSVIDDTASKKSKGGTAWSKIWNKHMDSCVGFRKRLGNRMSPPSFIDDEDDGHDNGTQEDDDDATVDTNSKKIKLPCYPSTTIYGHAAGRGLDVKRWSIGLDSGCVYEERLSALVLGGTTNGHDRVSYKEEDPNAEKNQDRWIPFGDKGRANIVSVKCQ